MGPIAKELSDRLWYLADPKVRWVRGAPTTPAQACLVANGDDDYRGDFPPYLSYDANEWLDDFVLHYADSSVFEGTSWWRTPDCNAIEFNEAARYRRTVLLMLEEAVDQAKWEGV